MNHKVRKKRVYYLRKLYSLIIIGASSNAIGCTHINKDFILRISIMIMFFSFTIFNERRNS